MERCPYPELEKMDREHGAGRAGDGGGELAAAQAPAPLRCIS